MFITRWAFKGPLMASILFLMVKCCLSQTPPKDFKNCKLNASSPFSYVVQIYDYWKKKNAESSGLRTSHFNFGALITCKAVLSTAWTYWNTGLNSKSWGSSGGFSRFTVIGQNIWDFKSASGRQHPCYQQRRVADIKVHPKAKEKKGRLLFDFSVIVLDIFFDIVPPSFPTALFPTDALELLQSIRYVNSLGARAVCYLPVPSDYTGSKPWTFADRIDFSSIPFRARCIRLLCEQQLYRLIYDYDNCARNFKKMSNATMLCIASRHSPAIRTDIPPVPTSYAGMPLVCNGTTLGISAQVKKRYGYYPDDNPDFFFVVTLLRVLPWLLQRVKDESPTAEPISFDDKTLDYVPFPTPHREPTPDWGHSEFYRLPLDDGHLFPLVPRVEPKSIAAMNCFPCFWNAVIIPLITSSFDFQR